MGISQLGGTSYNRLVTKANIGGITYAAVSLSVPNGGTSTWGGIIASTASEIAVLEVGFYTSGNATTAIAVPLAGYVDIGIGGAGSESILADVMIAPGNADASWHPGGSAVLPAPLRIGAGQRVALRATQLTSWGTTFALITHITYVPWTSLEGN